MNEEQKKEALFICESLAKALENDLDGEDLYGEVWSLNSRLCLVLGHTELVPDHCGKPEHDHCMRCGFQRKELPTSKIKIDQENIT